jgi:hypothetical protein
MNRTQTIAHMMHRNEVRGRVLGSMSIGVMQNVRRLESMTDEAFDLERKARAFEARLVNVRVDHLLPQDMPRSVKIALMDGMWDDETEICYHYLSQAMTKFDREGPYCFAKRLGLLKDNSAEDFSIEFMTYANSVYPHTY